MHGSEMLEARAIVPPLHFETFDAGEAARCLKLGNRVRRVSWPGRVHLQGLIENTDVMVALRDGTGFVPYMPSQEDFLATDWAVYYG
jgi:hypothetical protein